MTIRLAEAASITTDGQKARILLISEGVGSSGTYPADVLKRDGAAAFPAGTQLFYDHITESDVWERNGNHSIKDLIGVTSTDASFVEAENALYADATFFHQAASFISQAKDFIGLSVEASGEIVDGIVESILPSPLNAIAVVPRAGRGGKITELLESFRASGKIVTEGISDIEKEKKPMDEKDITAIVEGITAALVPTFTALTEALKPAPVEEKPVEVDLVAVVEAAHEAGLPKSARNRIAESAKNGGDYKALIEAEKADIDEIKKSVTLGESVGVVQLSNGANSFDASVGGWN